MSVNRNVTVPAGRAPSLDCRPGTTAANSSVTSRPLPMPAGQVGGRREIAVQRSDWQPGFGGVRTPQK